MSEDFFTRVVLPPLGPLVEFRHSCLFLCSFRLLIAFQTLRRASLYVDCFGTCAIVCARTQGRARAGACACARPCEHARLRYAYRRRQLATGMRARRPKHRSQLCGGHGDATGCWRASAARGSEGRCRRSTRPAPRVPPATRRRPFQLLPGSRGLSPERCRVPRLRLHTSGGVPKLSSAAQESAALALQPELTHPPSCNTRTGIPGTWHSATAVRGRAW